MNNQLDSDTFDDLSIVLRNLFNDNNTSYYKDSFYDVINDAREALNNGYTITITGIVYKKMMKVSWLNILKDIILVLSFQKHLKII